MANDECDEQVQIGVEDSRRSLLMAHYTAAVTAEESLSAAAITLQVLTATQLERDITTKCTLYFNSLLA